MARRLTRFSIFIALISILVGSVSTAAESGKTPQQAPAPAATQPIPFEKTDLARAINHDASRLKVEKTPMGMKLDLKGGFRSVLIVQMDASGKPVVSCIASEKEARRIFDRPAASKEH